MKRIIKIFAANVVSIAIIIILIFTLVSVILNYVTRHGESLTVPDIRGMKIADVERVLTEKKLRFTIIDTSYFPDKPSLSIVEQNPAPATKVKEGRMIYVSLNSNAAPVVQVPEIVDASVRQATAVLLSAGLKAGRIIYKPDIALNVVLEMLYRGQSVKPGTKIPKGSMVDLVLGDGLADREVPLPDLHGLSLEEAGNLLSSSSLNIGSVFFPNGMKDTLSARVFKQNPPYTEGKMIKGGQTVDLYLKSE